jgi:hypothetical protein
MPAWCGGSNPAGGVTGLDRLHLLLRGSNDNLPCPASAVDVAQQIFAAGAASWNRAAGWWTLPRVKSDG